MIDPSPDPRPLMTQLADARQLLAANRHLVREAEDMLRGRLTRDERAHALRCMAEAEQEIVQLKARIGRIVREVCQ